MPSTPGASSPRWSFWALLTGTFLIYPQLVYWALRAADTQKAELQNIVVDSFVVAIPVALLGFPL